MTPQNLNNVIFSVIKESLSAAKKEFYHRAIWDEAKKRAIESEVYVRVAHVEVYEGFIIFCDLGRAGFVKITPKSIKIVDSCPVAFLRPPSMQNLPIPVWDKKMRPRDAIKGLWELVNIEPKDRRLVIAWLMAVFQQEGTRVALLLEGVQGSAKTTTLKTLVRIFDPHNPQAPALHRQEKDLYIYARNRLIAAFDNVSDMKPATSDTLCQILSGGATSSRKLYSDGDEYVISAKALVAINGITTGVVRGDLLDRTLKLELRELVKGTRKTEKALNDLFVQRHPEILGALLRVAQHGLQNPAEPPESLDTGRLVDFAHWSFSWAPGLEWEPKKLVSSICENQQASREEVMNTDDVVAFIRDLLEQHWGTWKGRATDIHTEFGEWAKDRKFRLSATFPASAQAMSGWLRRAQPLLPAVGITCILKQSNNKYPIVLKQAPQGDKKSTE